MLLRGRGAIRAEDLAVPQSTGATSAGIRSAEAPPAGAGAADTRRRLALELAATDPGVSTGRLARAAGVGLSLARRELGALVAAGTLRRTGAGRAVRYVRP